MKKKIGFHLSEEHRDWDQGSGGAEKNIRTEPTDREGNLVENVYNCTGLFKMIVEVQLSSGNSATNSRNNHHLTIPFEGDIHSFKRQGVCVSRN